MKSASKEPKEAIGVIQTVDPKKPIVKELLDKDQEIVNFLAIRLPHVPYCASKMFCVYRSKDKTEVAYRVNWYKKEQANFISINSIVSSQYVKILIKIDGTYEIIK